MIARWIPASQPFLWGNVAGVAMTCLNSFVLSTPAQAAAVLSCAAPTLPGLNLSNQATYRYSDTSGTTLDGVSTAVEAQLTRGGTLTITPQGMRDSNGQLIYDLGSVATTVMDQLRSRNWSEAEAKQAGIAAIQTLARSPEDATTTQVLAAVKGAIAQAVPAQAATVQGGGLDADLSVALVGLAVPALRTLGLTPAEASSAAAAASAVVSTTAGTLPFQQVRAAAFQDAIAAVPTQATLLNLARQSLTQELAKSRLGRRTVQAGSVVRFGFALSNAGTAAVELALPSVATWQQMGLRGAGTVSAVQLEGSGTLPPSLTIEPGQRQVLWVEVRLAAVDAADVVAIALDGGCGAGISRQETLLLPPGGPLPPIDPFGQITGCAGEILPDYRGMQVALFRPAAGDNTGEVGELLPLVTTELPDVPNNGIFAGLDPNRQNSNPFALVNSDQGRYNFLLSRDQLQVGATYILVIRPRPDSGYAERRIRLTLGTQQGDTFEYTATSLDGRPISATDNRTRVTGILTISDATQVGLVLALLNLDASVCQNQSVQLIKTGDRAAAEPGDTVVYRLLVRNLATSGLQDLTLSDTLPLGFQFVPNSVRAEIQGVATPIRVAQNGSSLTFRVEGTLPQGAVLNLVYAAQLTPDSLRGTGQNSAIAQASRTDNNWIVRDGPAVHRLRIAPGIVSDCGTILGRVFEDKNFDGEQQAGEPGIPNAVIYLDDGNRITTDANGLYSVANALPGYRTGTLDLTSIPGYAIAPNRRFLERHSPSRLVQLSPGGLVRMNFAVTPASPSARTPQEAGQ